MQSKMNVSISGHVYAEDMGNGEVLVDKHNAIHPQNMARILARGLANEPNSTIYRMAFGNGGTFVDAGGNVVFNPPNDGSNGGWEARLYNETYSEVVDNESVNFGTDPGSADSVTVRPGGGASPSDDPAGGGVISTEVGKKSNVIITVILNENEPSGQLPTQNPGPVLEDDERTFLFDEIGLYSPGAPAAATSGYSSINVDDKTSESTSALQANTIYTLNIEVDGENYATQITTPASGSGTGGQFTYGDLCEGFNTGSWITGGDTSVRDYVYLYITDRSGGTYPSIIGRNSYGYLVFQSKTAGNGSTVDIECNDGDASDLPNILTGGICGRVNSNQQAGVPAGVANSLIVGVEERERLLSHIIFSPILKSANRTIKIVYTLTISVGCSDDTEVSQII